MNKLILLTILILTGCNGSSIEQVQPDNLKFHAGEDVVTTVAFYKGCTGTVTGFFPYKDVGNPTDFIVSFYCRGAGRIDDVRIAENKLLEKSE